MRSGSVSGLRNSCPSIARNSSFARFARSASRFCPLASSPRARGRATARWLRACSRRVLTRTTAPARKTATMKSWAAIESLTSAPRPPSPRQQDHRLQFRTRISAIISTPLVHHDVGDDQAKPYRLREPATAVEPGNRRSGGSHCVTKVHVGLSSTTRTRDRSDAGTMSRSGRASHRTWRSAALR